MIEWENPMQSSKNNKKKKIKIRVGSEKTGMIG